MTRSDWEVFFLKSSLWLHSGGKLGEVEPVKYDQLEARNRVGSEERGPERVVTVGTIKGSG